MDVAVVGPEPEVERPEERRDEGDVGERTADEVVAPVRRPVEPVRHGASVRRGSDGEATAIPAKLPTEMVRELRLVVTAPDYDEALAF